MTTEAKAPLKTVTAASNPELFATITKMLERRAANGKRAGQLEREQTRLKLEAQALSLARKQDVTAVWDAIPATFPDLDEGENYNLNVEDPENFLISEVEEDCCRPNLLELLKTLKRKVDGEATSEEAPAESAA